MLLIEPHRPFHLPQLHQLVNCHLSGVVPGWGLPASVIARSLRLRRGTALDPWVVEQATLCAVDGRRLIGAVHLLRYGGGAEVGEGYRGAAEIAWLLFWPEAHAAAERLLVGAHELLREWEATRVYACDTSLPVPVVSGVPESWPHVSDALTRAGFAPVPSVEETLYGGELVAAGDPEPPPFPGLTVLRAVESGVHRFRAELDGAEVGGCSWSADLSLGGALPALAGWAELVTLRVGEHWRGRGIGTWMVRQAAARLRSLGVGRVVIAVTAHDDACGLGRFYRRVGWEPLVRLERGWTTAP